MARPSPRITRDPNIEIIDEKSGTRVAQYGARFMELSLPRGTRVIYPNAPMEPLANVKAAIRHALNNPHDTAPLFAQLRPGMKLTIAIDDISMPLPPMQRPDIRELVLTEVLKLCADYGVDDIEMIIALCLHRRMTGPEVKRMVGKKIFNEYWPDRLYNHDAEDQDNIVDLGTTKNGYHCRINRRAVESDLLIYVNLNFVPMNGGYKSVAVGLCDYKSVSAHHNTETMHKCHSYMDPSARQNELNKRITEQGKYIDEKMNIFTIETAVNNRMFGGMLGFLNRPERTWSEFDRAKFQASNAMLNKLPPAARRKVFEQIEAPYGVIGVEAGKTEPVHKKIVDLNFKQYAVPVKGQCDVLIAGMPFISPYSVNAPLNPLLVQVMALGYLFNFYRKNPLVKKGGVMIITHPVYEEFHREHHPSYIEFYHRILSHSTDSRKITQFEKEFAENPDYVQMYRTGNAYHPVHPFYMWYWGDAGRSWIKNQVIVIGAEHERAPRQMGWRTAKNLNEALEMAQGMLGKSHLEITMSHAPPIMVTDVEL